MIKLIITADDYGIHKNIDDAIIKGINKGIINSVTVVMNMPRSKQALKRLVNHLKKKNLMHKIGIGIHLNITTGKPLVDSYNSSITMADGNFHKLGHYMNIKNVDLVNEVQIIKELTEQIDLFIDTIDGINNTDVPIDHFTSQHNVLHSLDKFAKLVSYLSYFYKAHGKHIGIPIPVRRPMPIGKEFGKGLIISRKIDKMKGDTWKYLKTNNPNAAKAIFALKKFTKSKFRKIIGSIFKHNNIKCPDLMFLSFFASPRNAQQKINDFSNNLNDIYDTAVTENIIEEGQDLFIEIVHHIGSKPSQPEIQEARKISGFNVEYFTRFRKNEFELINSIEYKTLLNRTDVEQAIYSDLNEPIA